jgi:hypothetical protein
MGFLLHFNATLQMLGIDSYGLMLPNISNGRHKRNIPGFGNTIIRNILHLLDKQPSWAVRPHQEYIRF